MKFNVLDWIAFVLVVVGGLNWGLIGLFNFNLVTAVFGMSVLEQIVYILVGLSALYLLIMANKFQKKGHSMAA